MPITFTIAATVQPESVFKNTEGVRKAEKPEAVLEEVWQASDSSCKGAF